VTSQKALLGGRTCALLIAQPRWAEKRKGMAVAGGGEDGQGHPAAIDDIPAATGRAGRPAVQLLCICLAGWVGWRVFVRLLSSDPLKEVSAQSNAPPKPGGGGGGGADLIAGGTAINKGAGESIGWADALGGEGRKDLGQFRCPNCRRRTDARIRSFG
jgi:hypothetical protein